jgi:TPR repeat protein
MLLETWLWPTVIVLGVADLLLFLLLRHVRKRSRQYVQHVQDKMKALSHELSAAEAEASHSCQAHSQRGKHGGSRCAVNKAPGHLSQAIAAQDSGQFAEAARLLRPLAEAGDGEAQALLGALMMHGSHRFATAAEMQAWYATATEEEQAAFARDLQPDLEEAFRWLQSASDQGIGPATHNLAMAYLGGYCNIPWDEQRVKAKELLAKAHRQGFGFFGGEEGQEAYLEFLSEHAAGAGGAGACMEPDRE